MYRPRLIAVCIVLLCLFSAAVFAQTSGSSLGGRVVDDSGASLPGVTITATNPATGISRVVVSGSDGAFLFPSLPVGTYRVVGELSGFSTVTVDNVVLNVATTRDLHITMSVASVQQAITVTAEAPLVATSASIGTIVSNDELENLPLNGRQFANLGSLAPGTQLSFNSDPTKPDQLTVALNGGSGRNVNYLVDGGDNTDDTIGGALQNFSIEAVQEFKIQTSQYKAEFGRSSGGVLSVVTRTGTNEFSGSIFGFFRDDSLNSKSEREKQADLDAATYERKQYGLSFGGPIMRDRAHFFTTYEKTDRTTEYSIDTDPDGPGGLPPIYPEFQDQAVGNPFDDELITAKVTADLSASQYLQVRYGYQQNTGKYGAIPIYLPSSAGTLTNESESILGGHTLQMGSNRVNEFLFQWSRFDNIIVADSDDPNLYFPSGIQSGQNINTPQSTSQEKSQFKDDFSWSSELFGSRHNFKAGLNYIHEPILGGDFSTGLAGQYAMLEDRADSPVSEITVFGGFFGDSTPVEQYNVFLQDDWAVNDRLTVNAGLRYDVWSGFDLDQTTSPLLPLYEAAAAAHPEIGWLQEFTGGQAAKLSEDKNNWGPRIGFAYDFNGDGKQIFRGGWGIYYDFPYTNANILFPAAGVQSTYGIAYSYFDGDGIKNSDGSFFRPGIDPLPPSQLEPGALFPSNIATDTFGAPQATQASLGYSVEVTDWLGLNFEAVSIDYEDIPFRFRANPRVDSNGDGHITAADDRLIPEISPRTRVWYGKGIANYDGINVGFRARSQQFEAQGFYTWSESDGNVLVGADEFRMWDGGQQPGTTNDTIVDPYDPRCDACVGPLYTDARHRVTLSGLYRAPYSVSVSGIFRYRSALPYTDHAGFDMNEDGYDMDLSPGVNEVNSLRGASFSQFDLRISKEFSFGGNLGLELIGEIFNLFNDDNPAAFIGNRSSAGFGEPTSFAGDPLRGEQRLAQLGLRVRY